MRHQRRLRALSLITDGGCILEPYGEIDLTHFSEIQSFTWRGINRGEDFQSLGNFFKANSKNLKTLNLDLVNWAEAERTWYNFERAIHGGFRPCPDNFFARKILGIQGAGNVFFQCLENLSLSAMSCRSVGSEMMQVFNFSNLRTLKLWNCCSSLTLLEEFVKTTQAPRLRSFELVAGVLYRASELERAGKEHHVIARFLSSFHGLEDLSLVLTDFEPQIPEDRDAILFNGILNHSPTLRRLTVHTRLLDIDYYSIESGDTPWCEQRDLLYRGTNLSYIGTGGSPSQLVNSFFTFPFRGIKHNRAWHC